MISAKQHKDSEELLAGERETDEGGTSYGPEGRGFGRENNDKQTAATELAARHRYDLFGGAAKHDASRPAGPFEKSVR